MLPVPEALPLAVALVLLAISTLWLVTRWRRRSCKGCPGCKGESGYTDEQLPPAVGIAAGPHSKYHVFLSHAGEQKHKFVSVLAAELKRQYPHIRYFLDETSLSPGDRAHPKILEAMRHSALVVVVLPREFVRKLWPMEELRYFLREVREERIVCIPVLYSPLDYQAACSLRERYDSEPWDVQSSSRPCNKVLDQWAKHVADLLRITAVRSNQVVAEADASLAELVVQKAFDQLRHHHCMPPNQHASDVELPEIRVGLEKRRIHVVQLLKDHGVVLLHGQGGIGKTTLAYTVYDHLKANEFAGYPCHVVRLGPGKTVAGRYDDFKEIQQEMIQALANQSINVTDHADGRTKLRNALQGRKVLLLVDNVWTVEDASTQSKVKQLDYLLPKDLQLGEGSCVLITSREKDAADGFLKSSVIMSQTGCWQEEVELMSGDESKELFWKHVEQLNIAKPSDDKEGVVDQVLDKCNGLPMALEVAGRALGSSDDLLHWQHWRDSWVTAFTTVPTGRMEVYDTLYAMYFVSWERMNDEQRELLLDIAHYFRDREWGELEAYADQHMLQSLATRGLVKRLKMDGGYEFIVMHDTFVDFCSLPAVTNTKLRPGSFAFSGAENTQPPRRTTFHGDEFVLDPNTKILELHGNWSRHNDERLLLPSGDLQCRAIVVESVALSRSLDCDLHSLRQLEMIDCTVDIADMIRGLPRLRILGVWSCRPFDNSPLAPSLNVQGLTNLQTLTFYGLHTRRLDGLEHLVRLKNMTLRDCKELQQLQGLHGLRSLEFLALDDCPQVSDVTGTSSLTRLTALSLQSIGTTALNALAGLNTLKRLRVNSLPQIDALCSLAHLSSLTSLVLGDLGISEPPDLSSLVNLQSLEMEELHKLHQLPCLSQLTSLTRLKLHSMPVQELECGEHLVSQLQELVLWHAMELQALADMSALVSLTTLIVCQARVQQLPGLECVTRLVKLRLWDTPLEQLPHLATFPRLLLLDLEDMPIRELPGLEQLEHLEVLRLVTLPNLTHINLPCSLSALEELCLKDLPLQDFSGSILAPNLRREKLDEALTQFVHVRSV